MRNALMSGRTGNGNLWSSTSINSSAYSKSAAVYLKSRKLALNACWSLRYEFFAGLKEVLELREDLVATSAFPVTCPYV